MMAGGSRPRYTGPVIAPCLTRSSKLPVAVFLAVLIAASGCMTPSGPPDYSRYDRWILASLVDGGEAVNLSDVRLVELTLPDADDQLRLAVRGCRTLRIRWRLIDGSPRHAGLRALEAISNGADCRESDGERALRDHLRNVREVHFEFERIELVSPFGRLILVPG